ncbi:hypothetical protein FOCC_FOCC009653, partial [Frankliniella occidentalis]
MDKNRIPPSSRYAENRRIQRQVQRELRCRREIDCLRGGASLSRNNRDCGSASSSSVCDTAAASPSPGAASEADSVSDPEPSFSDISTDNDDGGGDGDDGDDDDGDGDDGDGDDGDGDDGDGGDSDSDDEDDDDHDSQPSDDENPLAPEGHNDEDDLGVFVKNTLRNWTLRKGPSSMRKLDELLLDLRVRFPNLPSSYKTLLHTPRNLPVTNMAGGGQMWYRGIRVALDAFELEPYVLKYDKISLDIGIDGVSLSKTSNLKFWPILGKLVGSDSPPFVIAIYLGKKDPEDVYEFLMDFALEVESLERQGVEVGVNRYQFGIRNYILDAPARAFIKCCVLFNSRCSCEKCCVVGEYVNNRMTFTDLNYDLRTDESYENQTQPMHHIG